MKHIKEFTEDLKLVYDAPNEESALKKFLEFKEKWQNQYPSTVKSWEYNLDILSIFFAYPVEIRKIIYTTNKRITSMSFILTDSIYGVPFKETNFIACY